MNESARIQLPVTHSITGCVLNAGKGSVTTFAVLRMPFLLLRASMWVGLAAALVYVVATLAALVNGFVLPTAAIFHWGDWLRAVGEHDHYAAHFLIVQTSLCAAASWLAAMAGSRSYEPDLHALDKFLRIWGLPLTVCLFVFSLSGTWAGLARPGDFNTDSIGGLIPFSDANGYFAGAHDQARDGFWNAISLRRPLAAAFRSVLMAAAAFSFAQMLLIQVVLCSISVWLAARSILGWRGPLACIAFVALSLMICYSFFATALTEPLGLIWGFLSVACFVEALGRRSLQFALLGLAFTFMSLMTRMGAMFLLPAVMLWIACCFGESWRRKIYIAAAMVGIITAGLSTNFALQKIYGTSANLSGSNFAFTLCGLSIGQDWTSCPVRYADQMKRLEPDEKIYTDFLYSKAVGNILADPVTIVRRLAVGAQGFARAVLPTIMRGYLGNYLQVPTSRWLPIGIFLWISVMGLAIITVCRPVVMETLFWVFSVLAILVSSGFVYFDDGMRVMSGSYPLIAALAVSGLFAGNNKPADEIARPAWQWWGGLATALILFLTVPWIAHHTAPPAVLAKPGLNEQQVFGGRRISGFLVVADDQPLRRDVPSLHFTDFAKLITLSNVEIYQPLLKGRTPELPFGFISAPRMEAGLPSDNQFIVPAHVLLDKGVEAWRFKTAEWSRIEGNGIYWVLVTDAQPVKIPAR